MSIYYAVHRYRAKFQESLVIKEEEMDGICSTHGDRTVSET
jgi:hypothetical protein